MVLNRFLVLLFLCCLAPHFVWGFSLERTENYKKIALTQNLAENPQWLKLGHYHKTWSGKYKSKIRGGFFIAPDGAENPEHELQATLATLFSPETHQHQCRYLARMDWLKKVLPLASEDLTPCPERDAWKAQLGAKEMSIIFASNDLSSAGSSFGHTFLKLHNPNNTRELELLDYGVNYAAITGDEAGAFYALKGLFGFYPGAYSMLPYHQKIREYTNLEGRDLWEYKLKLSPAEVEFLVDHLLELDNSFSYYYFADENCSYQILELLNLVRPELDFVISFKDFVIPLDSVRALADLDLLQDEKLRPSLQSEWRARYAGLDLGEKSELRELLKSPRKFQFEKDSDKKSKAEILEAALSALAIQEYREQKEDKDIKYALAVQRAKLGPVTDRVDLPSPASPLLSQRAMAFYTGYGQLKEENYLRLKYRRAFHDLLSNDTGFSPFTHVEVLSFEFRSFFERKNFDLAHTTLINILSTAPTNLLDHPLSWNVDLGTQPKLAPYMDVAAGFSFDLGQKIPVRTVFLGRFENRTEQSKYAGDGGVQALLLANWLPSLHTVFSAKYLYDYDDRGYFWESAAGLAYSLRTHEVRFEYQNRREIPDWNISYIVLF